MWLIWDDFNMTTSRPKCRKKISAIQQMLLTLAVLTLLGWLILVGWFLYLWITQDFNAAMQCAERLSAHQLEYLTHTPVSIPSSSPLLNDVHHDAFLFFVLIKAATEVMFTKFVMLLSAIPLFFLSVMAGLIDGLNQRAIRAACLGRESTYVFHKSVPIARKSISWVLGLWLCIPITFSPTPIFVGLAVLLGFVMRVSASRFKKYL